MTKANLQEALDSRFSELREAFPEQPRDLILRKILNEQLEAFRSRLGDDHFDQFLRRTTGEVEHVIEEVPVTQLQSLPETWREFRDPLRPFEPAVGQIAFATSGTNSIVRATGWLIGWNDRRDLIITNSHVLDKIAFVVDPRTTDIHSEEIENIRISFSANVKGTSFTRAVQTYRDPLLYDLAVIVLENEVEHAEPLFLAERPSSRDELVVALGYPGLLPVRSKEDRELYRKLFSTDLNTRVASPGRITEVIGSKIHHNCTLAPGSSGSPLIDRHAKVVGVHYEGEKWKSNCAVAASEVARMLEELGL